MSIWLVSEPGVIPLMRSRRAFRRTEGRLGRADEVRHARIEPTVGAPRRKERVMQFIETGLEGVWLITPESHYDNRGAFTRTFCAREFDERGLATDFVQHSSSRSWRRHTLRGLHFQRPPHQEAKLVSCLQGAIWDVAVDIRPHSPTCGRWFAAELTAGNGHQLYIPAGFAHGFQTLADDSVTGYLISNFFQPGAARGLRYDDPALAITWPAEPACIAEKDLAWPPLAELASEPPDL